MPHNATVLKRRQAAQVFEEDETDAEELAEHLLVLATRPERLEAMSKAASRLACPGAARDLARLVVETALGETGLWESPK